MGSERIKQLMLDNAAVLRQLHRRVREAADARSGGPVEVKAWVEAARDYHDRYNDLAMPGGYDSVLQGLETSDSGAIDLALCFVELRPYFFRSGYMYTLLMRRLKKCVMNEEQAMRHARVVERAAAWRRRKRGSSVPS
jgi:hypothetical protein